MMNAQPSSDRRPWRTFLRTAVLTWQITVAALLVLVMGIIPQQKRTSQEDLESRAHGVAVSLHDVVTLIAVNDDQPRFVDVCEGMLQGDQSLEYLMFTRNDGLSLIVGRSGAPNGARSPAGLASCPSSTTQCSIFPNPSTVRGSSGGGFTSVSRWRPMPAMWPRSTAKPSFWPCSAS